MQTTQKVQLLDVRQNAIRRFAWAAAGRTTSSYPRMSPNRAACPDSHTSCSCGTTPALRHVRPVVVTGQFLHDRSCPICGRTCRTESRQSIHPIHEAPASARHPVHPELASSKAVGVYGKPNHVVVARQHGNGGNAQSCGAQSTVCERHARSPPYARCCRYGTTPSVGRSSAGVPGGPCEEPSTVSRVAHRLAPQAAA